MANKEQLKLLKKDVGAWNEWRMANSKIEVDLRHADLERSNLSNANLKKADLRWANIGASILTKTNFSFADLSYSDLSDSDLRWANFRNAHLERADFTSSDLYKANLRNTCLSEATLSFAYLEKADLRDSDLSSVSLVSANLEGANISGCVIHGISAWDVELENTIQKNLIITPLEEEPVITLDDLEVAQFIYLMLNNAKIKNVIDTITSKTVLILGRFTEERKKTLDALREELRNRNYLPIIFDFEKPASRDLTETITLLARMSRFIIADLSDPKSLPQELTSIIPELPSIPIQPIIISTQIEYSMYEHWKRYPWVLQLHKYKSIDTLIKELGNKVVSPPERWVEKQKNK
jgi:uncharacterized protein YjbI with pentapeptide repeats